VAVGRWFLDSLLRPICLIFAWTAGITPMCDIPRCRTELSELIYYGHNVCARHWYEHCDKKIDLKQVFKIDKVMKQ
jgi:hypothetical protein